MRKLTDFQIDSRRLSDLENEVTAARGHEASLKERIDGILADFRVDQAGFTEGHIVINVQPGLAYINDSTIYHSAPLVHLIQTPAANTEYYIYLDSSGGLSSTTEPATDADRLPLAIVRTGDTVEDISVTDVRPLLQKGGAAKEVQEARGNYASLGARINSLETVVRSYSFSETHIATEGQQVFALEHTYPLGADKLRVYVGGVLQDPGPEDDYVEADERTVTFNYPLPAGTVVRFVVENLVREAGFVEVYEAQPGQQEFRLAHPYPVGINRLRVYVNGLLYEPGADNDYVEIDEYTVTFNDPFNGGERVKFVLEDQGNNRSTQMQEVRRGLLQGF